MRAYPLKPFSESDKSASFAVISIHGSYVPQVRFLNGAEESREAESTIAAIKCNTVFPDEAPTRIFRGGNLSCSHLWKECRFILFPCPARDLFPHKVPLRKGRCAAIASEPWLPFGPKLSPGG